MGPTVPPQLGRYSTKNPGTFSHATSDKCGGPVAAAALGAIGLCRPWGASWRILQYPQYSTFSGPSIPHLMPTDRQPLLPSTGSLLEPDGPPRPPLLQPATAPGDALLLPPPRAGAQWLLPLGPSSSHPLVSGPQEAPQMPHSLLSAPETITHLALIPRPLEQALLDAWGRRFNFVFLP